MLLISKMLFIMDKRVSSSTNGCDSSITKDRLFLIEVTVSKQSKREFNDNRIKICIDIALFQRNINTD